MNQLTAKADVPTPAVQQRQISEQLSLTSAAISSIEDTLHVLEERLQVILRDPEPKNDMVGEDIQLVPLANELRTHHRRTSNINAILMDIIERVEL